MKSKLIAAVILAIIIADVYKRQGLSNAKEIEKAKAKLEELEHEA